MTATPSPVVTDMSLDGPVASHAKSVYCDTGWIVAIVMGVVDPFFDDAVRFLSEAKLNGMRLVISSLALAEAADVIRKRVKAGCRCTDEGGKEREAVEAEAAEKVEDLARFIDVLKADKMVDMLEDITEERLDLVHIHEKMLEYTGSTPQARRGNTYRHEGIGPIDWMHIVLALLAGAQAICTSDRAFTQIRGDKQYGGIEIIMLHPRHATGA